MALRNPPNWLQNASHSAENDRLIQQAIWSSTGIIGTSSLAITASSPAAMTVKVATGWAAIVGTTQSNMGVYTIYNDAQETLPITAADSLQPRIDRIVATVRDAYYSGTVNDVIFQVLPGTPAASPSAPATPANSISLATVYVAAGVTSITSGNITDTRIVIVNNNLTTQPTFSGCSLNSNVGTTINNATYTLIPWDIEYYDTDNYHSTVTNNSRITIPAGKSGKYYLNIVVGMGWGSSTGSREIRLYKNGAYYGVNAYIYPLAGQTTFITIQTLINLTAGDYLEIYVYQSQGFATSLSSQGTVFSVEYLGA